MKACVDCAPVGVARLRHSHRDAAGHYVLQGVMEVGSELMLKPDGTFEYMLAYGAADYWAKGTWKQEGKAVILHSNGKEEAPFRRQRVSLVNREEFAYGDWEKMARASRTSTWDFLRVKSN